MQADGSATRTAPALDLVTTAEEGTGGKAQGRTRLDWVHPPRCPQYSRHDHTMLLQTNQRLSFSKAKSCTSSRTRRAAEWRRTSCAWLSSDWRSASTSPSSTASSVSTVSTPHDCRMAAWETAEAGDGETGGRHGPRAVKCNSTAAAARKLAAATLGFYPCDQLRVAATQPASVLESTHSRLQASAPAPINRACSRKVSSSAVAAARPAL